MRLFELRSSLMSTLSAIAQIITIENSYSKFFQSYFLEGRVPPRPNFRSFFESQVQARPIDGMEAVPIVFGRGEARPSNKHKSCNFFYFLARLEYK